MYYMQPAAHKYNQALIGSMHEAPCFTTVHIYTPGCTSTASCTYTDVHTKSNDVLWSLTSIQQNLWLPSLEKPVENRPIVCFKKTWESSQTDKSGCF